MKLETIPLGWTRNLINELVKNFPSGETFKFLPARRFYGKVQEIECQITMFDGSTLTYSKSIFPEWN